MSTPRDPTQPQPTGETPSAAGGAASHRHAPSLLPFAMGGGDAASSPNATDEPLADTAVIDPTQAADRKSSRHAPSVPPWMNADKGQSPGWAEDTPGVGPQFVFGDSRKPQLSKHVAGPLRDSARRTSAIQPQVSRASGLTEGGGLRPKAIETAESATHAERPPAPAVIATPQRKVSDIRPTAVQEDPGVQGAEALRRAQLVAQATARSALRAADARVPALLGLLAAVAALLLPAGPGLPALYAAMFQEIPCAWPMGMMLASAGTALTAGVLLVSLAGGTLRPPSAETPVDPADVSDGGSLLAVVVALATLWLREGAAPGALLPTMWPMRGDLFGIPTAIWCGLLGASLLSLGRRPVERPARVVGGVAAAALTATYWQPLTWIGKTSLPLLFAFTADSGHTLQGEMVEAAIMAAPVGTVLMCLMGPAGLALLLLPRGAGRGLTDGLGLAVAVAPAVCALMAGSGGLDLGAVTTALFLTAATCAAALSALSRWSASVDDETESMVESSAVFLMAFAFVLLKVQGGRYSATDEGIYFYAAKAWVDGIWPYHDYFFSHPPLHIAVPATVIGIFGWSFPIVKSLSAIASLLTGIVVWRIGRRHIGAVCGLLACGFFLFAAETLKASTNLTGVNLTTLWLTLAVWAALRDRAFMAGLFAGIAASTGIYAVAGAIALVGMLAFATTARGEDRPRSLIGRLLATPAVQLIIGFALVFGTIHILGVLVGGESYLDGVYRYHTQKKVKIVGYVGLENGPLALLSNLMATLQSKDFLTATYYHGAHFWLALWAPLAVALRIFLRRAERDAAQLATLQNDRRVVRPPQGAGGAPNSTDPLDDPDHWAMMSNPRRWWRHPSLGGASLVVWIVTVAMLGELAQLPERYDFYYTLMLPFAAISAAVTLTTLLWLVRVCVGAGVRDADMLDARSLPSGPLFVPAQARWALVGLALCCAAWVPVNAAANRAAFPTELAPGGGSKGAGQLLRFEWIDAPGPKLLSDLGRALFWRDWRVRGNLESGVLHYLWSKKRWFSTADTIAATIASRSRGSDTLTGASTYAPIVALLAGRRMAADHVDTNSKTFKTGIIDEAEFWTRACKDNLRFIVAAPQSWFTVENMNRKSTVVRHFRLLEEFHDPALRHWRDEVIQLWERKGEAPCRYETSLAPGPADGQETAPAEPGAAKPTAIGAPAAAKPPAAKARAAGNGRLGKKAAGEER